MLNDPLNIEDEGPVEFDLDFIEYRASKLADMSPAYRTQLALVSEVRRLRAEVDWMRGVRPQPDAPGHESGAGCACGPLPGAYTERDGTVARTLRHRDLAGAGVWLEHIGPDSQRTRRP